MLSVIRDDGSVQTVLVIRNHDVKVYADDKHRTLTIVASTEEYKNQLIEQVLSCSKPSEFVNSGDGEIWFRFSEEEWKQWAIL